MTFQIIDGVKIAAREPSTSAPELPIGELVTLHSEVRGGRDIITLTTALSSMFEADLLRAYEGEALRWALTKMDGARRFFDGRIISIRRRRALIDSCIVHDITLLMSGPVLRRGPR